MARSVLDQGTRTSVAGEAAFRGTPARHARVRSSASGVTPRIQPVPFADIAAGRRILRALKEQRAPWRYPIVIPWLLVPTRVQAPTGTSGTGTTATCSFASNVTAGNFIAVHVSSAVAANTPTDTRGHTYVASQAETVVNASNRTRLFYVPNITGGANTVTVTFGSSSAWILNIVEYSGVKLTSPLLHINASTGFGTAASSGSVTTTIADTLLLSSGVIENPAGDTIAAGSGWTEVLNTQRGSAVPATGHLEERMPNATGTYTGTATLASSTNWAWQIAAFEGLVVPVTLEQEGSQWRLDNGTEVTATADGAQDTDVTLAPGDVRRVRHVINVGGNPTSLQLRAEYRKVGDTNWRRIT